ncbi:hypothetical protein [Nocardia sp. CA-290969]|uniref:hypothetical protein n=1 Tax=Nocardia sp. CA-290969 TaxID=3239986 RepID=UPI003D90FABD
MTDTASSLQLQRDPTKFLARHREALSIAIDYADQVCRSSGVPDRFRGRPTDSAVAILYGADLGLSPLQSLQQIYNKFGQPAVYARTMQAILEANGYRFETVLDTDEAVTVRLTTPDGRTEENTWDWERAEKAGYTPRPDPDTGDWARTEDGEILGNEKYVTDPRAMYWAKAVSVLARHLAPHLLLGLPYTWEDLESETRSVATEQRRAAQPVTSEAAQAGAAVVQDWTPTPDPFADEEEAAPAPTPATPAQQERLDALLVDNGHRTAARKRNYLSKAFGREVASVADLTAAEADTLLAPLEGPDEPAVEDTGPPADETEGSGPDAGEDGAQ